MSEIPKGPKLNIKFGAAETKYERKLNSIVKKGRMNDIRIRKDGLWGRRFSDIAIVALNSCYTPERKESACMLLRFLHPPKRKSRGIFYKPI